MQCHSYFRKIGETTLFLFGVKYILFGFKSHNFSVNKKMWLHTRVVISFWEKRKINVSVEKYWTCLSIMSLTLPKSHESFFQRGDFRNHHIFLKAQCFLSLTSLHCHTVWRVANVCVSELHTEHFWQACIQLLIQIIDLRQFLQNWVDIFQMHLNFSLPWSYINLNYELRYRCTAQYFEGIWVFVLTSYELF